MKKKNRFEDYETNLFQQGFSFVCGVDEVGRGPWAGPMTAVAVRIKNYESRIMNLEINDSKKLTEEKREKIFDQLIKFSDIQYYIAWVSAKEIDKIGLQEANYLVLKKAVKGLEKKIGKKIDYVLVDGYEIKGLGIPQEKIIKGDEKVLSIAIASIIAKVTRDRYMKKIAKKYPQYSFEKHKGYGTSLHLAMLKKFGPCPEHRKSFRPIKNF